MFPVFSVPSTILEAECELYIFSFLDLLIHPRSKAFSNPTLTFLSLIKYVVVSYSFYDRRLINIEDHKLFFFPSENSIKHTLNKENKLIFEYLLLK